MKKRVVLIISAAVITAGSGLFLYNFRFLSKPSASPDTSAVTTPTSEPLSDPTKHDTFDVEFSKKLILYHELAAQLDNYAKDNATTTEIQEYATKQSAYNMRQAAAYANMLDSWGEKYSNLEDFPKTAGGACAGYPVFPGMLPHAEVNSYLQTLSTDVDKQYLALMLKHHGGINLLVKAEGHFVNYGELIKLRDTFYSDQDKDVEQLRQLQQNLGYSES